MHACIAGMGGERLGAADTCGIERTTCGSHFLLLPWVLDTELRSSGLTVSAFTAEPSCKPSSLLIIDFVTLGMEPFMRARQVLYCLLPALAT